MSVNSQTIRLIMKKMIFAAVAVAVLGMNAQTVRAGECEWATVGKVLTGVAAGVLIAKAVDGQPAYASVSYGYAAPGCGASYAISTRPPCPPPPRIVCAPPVVYAPAPVVVYQPAYCAPRPAYYAPAPIYQVSHGHPGRGNTYGHDKGHGYGHY